MARVQGLAWLIVAAAAGASLGACPDAKKRPNGADCEESTECSSGLCVEQLCMDPAEDDDHDGLSNGLEARLGTSPRDEDTDQDGKPDPTELTADLQNKDTDGDGRPDALESARSDSDGDCIPDELDPDNTHPDPATLAAACNVSGVCADLTASLTLNCETGTAVCNYTHVPRFEPVETECDGLDNDCDGITDENCGEAPLDCAAVLAANPNAADGSYALDPDGAAGMLQATQTPCLMSAERGGWTRWTAVVANARRTGLREYLLYKDGAWYRTPPTTLAWDWNKYTALSGRWVIHRRGPGSGQNGVSDLDWLAPCEDRGEAGLFGFGCGDGAIDGMRLLPGGASDPSSGTGAACDSAFSIFSDSSSCNGGIEIYVRWVTCATDPDSELGDGGFQSLAGASAATPADCWELKGDVFGPSQDVRAGGSAPSLVANDPVSAGDPYAFAIAQHHLMLVLGHAYHLSLWAKAASARVVPIAIEAAGGPNLVAQGLTVTTEWHRFDIDFLARRTVYDGVLELDLGSEAIGDVWIDDVVVSDLGAGACGLSNGELLSDTSFARGLTCWVAQNDDTAHATVESVLIADNQRAARVTASGATDGEVAYLEQTDVPLHADAWYERTVEAEATPTRTIEIAIVKDDFSLEYARYDLTFDATRTVQTRRFVVPAGATPRAVKVRAGVPLTPAGEVTFFQLRLQEMGPNPCATPDGANELLADGDFHYGTLCWDASASDPATTFASAANTAPEGQPPTMLVTMAHTATQANLRQRGLTLLDNRWYEVHVWLRSDTRDPVDITVHEPDGAQIFYADSVLPSVGWAEAGGRFVTHVGTPGGGALDFGVARPGAGNFVELDLARLTDLGPSPCVTAGQNHLVDDPTFTGGLTCWKLASVPGVDVRQELADTSSPPIAIATVIQTPGAPSDLVLFQGGLALEGGVRYTMSFRARSLGATRPVTAVVSEDSGALDYLRTDASVTANWQTFSFDFTPQQSTATAVVALELAGYSANVIVDDVDVVAHP